jgi:Uma2 family endonuclease
MAFVLGDRPVRLLTADEVLRMLDAGVLEDAQHLELLHGVLTEKGVKSPEHGALKRRLWQWLHGDGRLVMTEDPLVTPDGLSAPEPDIAVVEPGDYLERLPTTAWLVVEVAKTSLKIDAQVKPALYAAMGVPDYWVVDVHARRVRVHRDPGRDGYASVTVHGPTGELQPLRVAVAPLALEALFAGVR